VQPTVRVFVVVGLRVYRDALAELLGAEPRFEVIGLARDGSGIEEVRRLGPDVVLVDSATVESPSTIGAIVDAANGAKVVAFGVPDRETEVIALAEAGVAGFVGREQSFEDVVTAVESATRGEVFCPPKIATALLARVAALAAERRAAPVTARLTARELEIVDLIAAGLTNRQIGRRLCIEVATVKNHVHNILEKLEVEHRADAVARVRSARA
jgi:DNA-binding NarL/FixJ family response regulator